MASRQARSRAHRRDRRKAKASGWKRVGKPQMGRVGHGASGPTGAVDVPTNTPKPIGPVPHSPRPTTNPKFRLRVPLMNLIDEVPMTRRQRDNVFLLLVILRWVHCKHQDLYGKRVSYWCNGVDGYHCPICGRNGYSGHPLYDPNFRSP